MEYKTREELKEFFETGDKPTETQFAALIDALLHQEDKGLIAEMIFFRQRTQLQKQGNIFSTEYELTANINYENLVVALFENDAPNETEIPVGGLGSGISSVGSSNNPGGVAFDPENGSFFLNIEFSDAILNANKVYRLLVALDQTLSFSLIFKLNDSKEIELYSFYNLELLSSGFPCETVFREVTNINSSSSSTLLTAANTKEIPVEIAQHFPFLWSTPLHFGVENRKFLATTMDKLEIYEETLYPTGFPYPVYGSAVVTFK